MPLPYEPRQAAGVPCKIAEAHVTANTAAGAADGVAFAEALDSAKLPEYRLRPSRCAYRGKPSFLLL